MKKLDLTGQKCERLEAVWFAWSKNGQAVWMCICDCGQIRFLTAAQFQSRNRQSCGCLRRETSRQHALEMNKRRAGKPRSSKGKLASQDACKKMNLVRHLKARHILDDVDPFALIGHCRTCGMVPIKVMKHRANEALRDQYLCWVGTRSREADKVAAVVAYPNQALEMWDKQQGDCAVCSRPMVRAGNSSDGATLDHCHVTGRLRGFLHQGCNKGLGHFLDDPEVLKKAAEYLLRQS